MDAEVVTTVEQLKAAGTDLSKQVPALVKLGDCYLKKAKTTSNAADFTKANALYNAALVRTRKIHHEMNEDQILQRIVETYREFLRIFADGDEKFDPDEIRYEIRSHKEFLVDERRTLKERVDEISSFLSKSNTTKEEYEIHANQIQNVFQNIQDMYIKLVSMLAKECESKLGQPPCNYAIIALGSVARMEATPFSDLEFAILHSNEATGEEIDYFRVLTHFLHMKVLNLGETILPVLAIEELNDFQSSDSNGSWFYDSETPRGISFDGAMPWASKTPLERMETKNKPALELIGTPEQMAEFQDEEVALKQGYHLAEILSKTALLYGDDVLLNEYNERVCEKLSAESSETGENRAKTVGVLRGMRQMELDIQMYDPFNTYMGINSAAGGYFDAKNQFYRLISLLLSDLGMIFNVRCPSPWEIISELFTREIISESQSVDMRKCLSFANEIRLKTYFANNGQKELISPLAQYANPTQQSVNAAVFQDVDQNVLVNFLNSSYHIHRQCKQFYVDGSIFCDKPASLSNAFLKGIYHYRLQNFPEALKWMKSESKVNPYYVHCLVGQGHIYLVSGEYDKSIKCFEEALQLGYQNQSSADVPKLYNGMANALFKVGEHEMAIDRTKEAINKHNEIFGKKSQDSSLIILWVDLGNIYHSLQRFDLALQAFNKAQEIEKELTGIPDMFVACIYINLAVTLSELDQQEESIKCIEKGLQLSQKVLGKDNLSIFLAEHYTIAGRVYHRCKQEDDAVRFFERSLELYERIVGNYPHPGKIEALNDYGVCLLQRHQTGKAADHFKSALKLATAANDKKPHITLAKVQSNLGVTLVKTGKPYESLWYFVQAKETMDKLLGSDNSHPLTSCILDCMEANYHMVVYLTKLFGCKDNCYNPRMVVYVLVALIKKYAEKGSIFDCIKFYLDARQIAKSLPKEDSLPDSTLEMLKLMEI